jgi:prepilin-type N-terminal cleavage/methylation domain-containing protein
MRAARLRRSANRPGFTMIELVLVIVIGGVVTGMALPRVRDLMAQQRVARAATAIQNDLEAAYAISSRNRRPIRIAWDAANMQMVVTDRLGTTFYRKTSLGTDAYGLRSASVAFSRSPLEIYPNGLANDTLTIALTGTNTSKRVRMTRAGMVRIE